LALPGIKGTVWSITCWSPANGRLCPCRLGPHNGGRFFSGLTVDPDTPRETYQSSDPAAENEENLANTRMETYHAPSSCMACHANMANWRGPRFCPYPVGAPLARYFPGGTRFNSTIT
jgi:hypothetical protein